MGVPRCCRGCTRLTAAILLGVAALASVAFIELRRSHGVGGGFAPGSARQHAPVVPVYIEALERAPEAADTRKKGLPSSPAVAWCRATDNATVPAGPFDCRNPHCGDETTLVVLVVETWYFAWRKQMPTARAARDSIRRTWFNFSTTTSRAFFVLAIDKETKVPKEYAQEAAANKDMAFVLCKEKHPGNLAEKTRLAFLWAEESCPAVKCVPSVRCLSDTSLWEKFCSKGAIC